MKNFVLISLFLAYTVVAVAPVQAKPEKVFPQVIKFGMRETSNTGKLWKKFGPLFRYIQTEIKQKTGEKVFITFAFGGKDYDAAQQLLEKDRAHLGRYGPVSYVQLHDDDPQIAVLAIEEGKGKNQDQFKGYFIAKSGNEIPFTRNHLRGKKIGFGAPDSTLGTILASKALMDLGLCRNDVEIIHYPDHADVMKAVLRGEVHIGALKGSLVEENMPNGRLQIVHTMWNNMKPFVVNTRLISQEGVSILQAILTDMATQKAVGKRFLLREDSFYDSTRQAMEDSKQFLESKCGPTL